MAGKGIRRKAASSLCALALSAGIGARIDGEPKNAAPRPQKTVPVHVFYDQAMLEQHGERLFDHLRGAIGEHNKAWRGYRDERMEVARFTYWPRPADSNDSYYLLNKLVIESPSQYPGEERIYFLGENTMVYDYGTPRRLDGLTNMWGDATIVSVGKAKNRDPSYLGAVIMHEQGHHFGAKDDPLPGGKSMYTWEAGKTFAVDIGNAGQIRSAPDRKGQDDPNSPYAYLMRRLIHAHTLMGKDPAFPLVREALLHYPSASNPEFVAARKRALEAAAPENRDAAERVINEYFVSPPRAATSVLDVVGRWYWRADAEYNKGDTAAAAKYIAMAKRTYNGDDKRVSDFLDKAEANIEILRWANEESKRLRTLDSEKPAAKDAR